MQISVSVNVASSGFRMICNVTINVDAW